MLILIEETLTEQELVDIISEALEEVKVLRDFEEEVTTKTTALSLLRIMRLLNLRQ